MFYLHLGIIWLQLLSLRQYAQILRQFVPFRVPGCLLFRNHTIFIHDLRLIVILGKTAQMTFSKQINSGIAYVAGNRRGFIQADRCNGGINVLIRKLRSFCGNGLIGFLYKIFQISVQGIGRLIIIIADFIS